MRIVYANARNVRMVKWMIPVCVIIGILLFILHGLLDSGWIGYPLMVLSFFCIYSALFFGPYFLRHWTIDEESDNLTASYRTGSPIKISNIATVKYKVSRRGRYQSIFIQDIGAGFMEIKTSRKNADAIVRHIVRLNPEVKVDDSGLNDDLRDSIMLRPLI